MNNKSLLILTICFTNIHGGKDGIGSDAGKNAGAVASANFVKGVEILDFPQSTKNLNDAGKAFGSDAASKFQAIAEGTKAAGAIGLAVGATGLVAHEIYDRYCPEPVTKLNRFKAEKEIKEIETVDTLMNKFQQCFHTYPKLARNQLGIPAFCTGAAKRLLLRGQRHRVMEVVRTYEDFDKEAVYKASPEQVQQEYARCLNDNANGKMRQVPSHAPSDFVIEVPEKCEQLQAHCAVLSSSRAMSTYTDFLRGKYPQFNFVPMKINNGKYITTYNHKQEDIDSDKRPSCGVSLSIE